MKKVKWPAVAVAVGLLFSFGSRAHAAPEVKMGGVLFAQDVMTVSPRSFAGADAKGRSAVEVTRAYLQVDVKFDEHWQTKLLLEGLTTGTAANNVSNIVSLKGASLSYLNLMDTGINVQGGMFVSAWESFENMFWRRYVGSAYGAANGLYNVWDKGAGVYGKLPFGYGDYSVSVVNGEGQITQEGATGATGRQKSGVAFLSIVPIPQNDMLKGLRLNAYVQQEKQGLVSTVAGEGLLPSREKNRLFAGASYKNSMFYTMFTYYFAPTATGTTFANNAHTRPKGYSAHGAFSGLPWDLTVFGRFDRFDAGVNQQSQANGVTLAYAPKTTGYVGIERKMNDNIRMSLVGINTHQYNKDQAGTAPNLRSSVANETTLGLYAEAKF